MKKVKTLAWLLIIFAFLGCAEEPLIETCYTEKTITSYLSHTKSDPAYLNKYLIKLERVAGETISPELEKVIFEFGDGEVAVITGVPERLSEDQYLWTYEVYHTYQTGGEFDIAIYKDSWGQITEDDEPLITNKLVIDPRLGRNSVPTLIYVKPVAHEGCMFSVSTQDVEGDSIVYEIINPNGKSTFIITNRESLLVKTRSLNTDFSVLINEFRDKRHLGYTQFKVSKEPPTIME